MRALRITTLDAYFIQVVLDDQEVVGRQDGVTHSRVYNCIFCLDSSQINVLTLSIDNSCALHSECPVVLVLTNLAPEYVFICCTRLGILG